MNCFLLDVNNQQSINLELFCRIVLRLCFITKRNVNISINYIYMYHMSVFLCLSVINSYRRQKASCNHENGKLT